MSELKRLTQLICYACLNYDVTYENTKITIYYGFVVDRVRLINVSPRMEYGDNFRALLNLAVAQNTPKLSRSEVLCICVECGMNSHVYIESHVRLFENESIGTYAKMILTSEKGME